MKNILVSVVTIIAIKVAVDVYSTSKFRQKLLNRNR
jgi:hypothetical protein